MNDHARARARALRGGGSASARRYPRHPYSLAITYTQLGSDIYTVPRTTTYDGAYLQLNSRRARPRRSSQAWRGAARGDHPRNYTITFYTPAAYIRLSAARFSDSESDRVSASAVPRNRRRPLPSSRSARDSRAEVTSAGMLKLRRFATRYPSRDIYIQNETIQTDLD